MEKYCTFISVKCSKDYTDQFEGSNVAKTFGNCSSSVAKIYKCYGDYDFMICFNPSSQQESTKMVDDCITMLRSQPWVTTTTTNFGKECYTQTAKTLEHV